MGRARKASDHGCDEAGRAAALLSWYRGEHRELPWRASPGRLADPYRTLVAEAMLQQTQVATVVAYFERFVGRFATVGELAGAEEGEVLRMWQGLGYYRRARHLHRAAKAIVGEHGGVMPSTAAGLRRLPGVGAYTAGAIASIAFGEREPVVDGNVMRVLARWYAYEGAMDDAKGRRWAWGKAGELLEGVDVPQVRGAGPAGLVGRRDAQGSRLSSRPSPEGRRGENPGDWNQALMELGATVCTPRSPDCGSCAVGAWCEANRRGLAERLPVTGKRSEPVAVTHRVIAVERGRGSRGSRGGGRWLVERRGDGGLWAGMWQMPTEERGTPGTWNGSVSAAGLTGWVRERFGLAIGRPAFVGAFDHRTTHRLIRFEVWRVRARAGRLGGGAGVWRRVGEFDELAMSNAQRRVLAMLGAG